MDITEVRRSELYNTLSWMGLLSTEEYRIREVRNSPSKYYIDLDLENTDIERVGYLYPHVKLKSEYKDVCELWYGDKYINSILNNFIGRIYFGKNVNFSKIYYYYNLI